MFQQMANMQAEAQDCLASQMNLYLDAVNAIGERYGYCKAACIAGNAELRKELAEIADEQRAGQRTRYFDPMTSDPCLSECRSEFYFVFGRTNRYFGEEKGFYVESARDFAPL